MIIGKMSGYILKMALLIIFFLHWEYQREKNGTDNIRFFILSNSYFTILPDRLAVRWCRDALFGGTEMYISASKRCTSLCHKNTRIIFLIKIPKEEDCIKSSFSFLLSFKLKVSLGCKPCIYQPNAKRSGALGLMQQIHHAPWMGNIFYFNILCRAYSPKTYSVH